MQQVSSTTFDDCDTLDEKIKAAAGLSPRYGPYSPSRLNRCDYNFRLSYPHLFDEELEKSPESLSRFGTDVGKAVHKGLEVDTSMRMQLDKSKWYSPGDITDRMMQKYPSWDPDYATVRAAIEQYRNNFEMAPENYVGSEEYLGSTLLGERAQFENDDATWMRGVIDYLEINDANIARVVDYKNYPTILKYRKLNGNVQDKSIFWQLMTYTWLVFVNYPSVEQAYYEVYHANPDMGGVSKTSSRRDEHGEHHIRYVTREEVKDFWRLQQERMIRQEEKEEFHPQPSSKRCQYCDFPHDCPFWMDDDRDIDQETSVIRSEEKAKERFREYIVLDEQRTRLDSGLKQWAKEDGPIELEEEDAFYGYKPRTREKPHTGRILEALAKDLGIDQNDGVEQLIEAIKEKGRLTKGSSKKLICSIEDDELREAIMESGYVRTESVRKTKNF